MPNNDNFSLTFISQNDFETHVADTLQCYDESLRSIDLKKFNHNKIDPIKFLFDKEIFQKSFKEAIAFELQRQRDKHNNNSIGYFHQNIFKYIAHCEVPKHGWDVIFHDRKNYDIFVEMKNKHNTMNSSAAQKTYIRMQNQIIHRPNCLCMLVEAIAKKSGNTAWSVSVDGQLCKNEQIRQVSLDIFYQIVTGINDAFYQMCMQLPKTIRKLIAEKKTKTVEKDTIMKELKAKNPDILMALYMLAFDTYEGFKAQ